MTIFKPEIGPGFLGDRSVVYKYDLTVENNDFNDSLFYTNYSQANSHNFFVTLSPISLGE